MVAVIENKREAIASACERHQVASLYVFGSALRDDFQPGASDVDLLVEFSTRDPFEKKDAYFELLDELRVILGVEVDLVMVGAVKNRYIAQDIESSKQLLYAA